MKNLFLLTIIFSLTFLTGCSKNIQQPENIFSSLTNQQYTNDLSLEDGYKIILPFVQKWSDDAILQKLMTNVVDQKTNFKTNVYSFESIKKRKTLSITYNYKHPIDEKTFSGFGNPESENNNKFNIQEVDWPSDINKETISESLKKSKYNYLDKYLSSEKIIELAKKDGLDDFISEYQNSSVKDNNIWLFEYSEENTIEWTVIYWVGNENSIKVNHSFSAKYNPITGELLSKKIK